MANFRVLGVSPPGPPRLPETTDACRRIPRPAPAAGTAEPVPARRTSSPRPPEAVATPAGGPLGRRGIVPSTPAPPAPSDGSDASPDDPELASSGLIGAPLIAQMLGGTVIDEIPDPPA